MRLFSYVVVRDYGFAPNPFYGICTLATCKPGIRGTAEPGDWVIGTGSQQKRRRGYLVYAMEVSGAMRFTEYWANPAYTRKRPNLRGSWKQAYGDNIYWRDRDGGWRQLNGHHSHADGRANSRNIARDTSADRVLVGMRYTYCGGDGPRIPERFRNFEGSDICAQHGHKCRFPGDLVSEVVAWLEGLGMNGLCGRPDDWTRRGD